MKKIKKTQRERETDTERVIMVKKTTCLKNIFFIVGEM